ncbi:MULTISPECIES: TylF/MycF/NovP-related O-methyltransferase [unclassified Inquilinus]|uniref:TylF/MycF/NovP-related O-methyltransferase n=1 Tax=unclassified Inquilinus TaxID=2645927 RepID=UPI003F91D7D6
MLEQFAKKFVDVLLLPTARRLRRRLGTSTVVGVMQQMARERSAAYGTEHMKSAILFDDPDGLRPYAFKKRVPGGLNLEFGVWQGKGVNTFASLTDEMVYGFDSFEGLMEDWGGQIGSEKGLFDVGGQLPKVRSNVRLIKGWFQDTLPGFLAEHPGDLSFMNVDCDTYEATTYVLQTIDKRIVVGTIIIFDEYLNYPGWELGEYKAWQEFCAANAVTYDYLAIYEGRVALKVTGRS